MLLAGSMSAMAQTANQPTTQAQVKSLKPITIVEKAEAPEGKDALRATTTTIGRGKQELRATPPLATPTALTTAAN